MMRQAVIGLMLAAAPTAPALSAVLVNCWTDVVVMVPDAAWQPPPPRDGSKIRPARPGAEQDAIDRWYAEHRPRTAVLTRIPVACEDQTGLLRPRWRPGAVINMPPADARDGASSGLGFNPRHHDVPLARAVPAPGATVFILGVLLLAWARWSRRTKR